MLQNDNKTYYVDDNGDGSGVIGVYGVIPIEEPTKVFVVNQPAVEAPQVITTVAPTDQVAPTGTTAPTIPTTTTTAAKVVSDSKVGNKMLLIAIVMVVVVATALFLTFKAAK